MKNIILLMACIIGLLTAFPPVPTQEEVIVITCTQHNLGGCYVQR